MKTATACFLVSFGLFVGALPRPTAQGASNAPTLVIPPSKATLQANVDLPGLLQAGGGWRLVEIDRPGNRIVVQSVSKIAADGTAEPNRSRITIAIPPAGESDKPRRFRLESTGSAATPASFAFSDDSPDSLRLVERDKPVLVYNHGVITDEKVPSKDGRRSRACYIHPLWGVNSEILTDDFPVDHYHHHGVFWAWPHVEIGSSDTDSATGAAKSTGEMHDLWMYKDISQKFVRWLGRETGPLAAVLGVENGWFVGDRKVMVERVWIQVNKATATERAIDLDFSWIPVDRPITLRGAEGKSYGGLTIRFAVRKKDEKNSLITVPAGPAEQDLPETPLPWADMTYKFTGMEHSSGAAIFIPRDHPNYPPTWLTRHYGPLCIGWPGVNGQQFEPGKPIHLHYRIWIHGGAVDVAQLKAAYEGYLAEAEMHWE